MSYSAYPTDLNQPLADLLLFVEGKACCKHVTARAAYEVLGVGMGATIGYDPSAEPCPCPAPKAACPPPSKDEQVACLKAALEHCKVKQGAIGDWFKSPVGQQVLQTALTVLMSLVATL